MKRYLTLCACFWLLAWQLHAQVVRGTIFDAKTNEPLMGVNVLLQNNSDTTKQLGVATNENGYFELDNVPKASYKLRITYIGYQTQVMNNFNVTTSLDLDTLRLSEESELMKEITIEATMIRVEQKGDTTQYNAAAYKTNPDATVEDLIKKMPGITVENGTVKAQGEDVKKVTIDGKDFFGDDASSALRNLPAEVVDKIQVFDRQSDQSQFTGFDDGQSVKALNIVTKTGNISGQFGKAYAGYGTDDRYQAGFNYNHFKGDRKISLLGMSNNINQQNFGMQDLFGVISTQSQGGGGGGGGRGGGGGGGFNRTYNESFLSGNQSGITSTNALGLNYNDKWGKKVTISGSYFFNQANNSNNSALFRNYFTQTGSDFNQLYSETTDAGNNNFNHRGNLRLEYQIDSSNSIIFTPRISWQDNKAKSYFTGLSKLSNGSLLSETQTNNDTRNNGYNLASGLQLRHKFKKQGRTISLDMNGEMTNRKRTALLNSLNEYTENPDSVLALVQSSDNLTNSKSGEATLMYTEPLNQLVQLSFRYNGTFASNSTDKETNQFDSTTNAYTTLDSTLTNKFENTYMTQRVGFNLRGRTADKKANFMVAVNYQYATLDGAQSFPKSYEAHKDFQSILPLASFDYRFSKSSNLRLFYRAYNTAPTITQLQNVVDNSNPLLLSAGNSDLRQTYSHSLTGRYTLTNSKKATSFFANTYLTYTNNYIGNSTIIATQDTLLNDAVVLKKGSQLTTLANLNSYISARTFLVYGTPLAAIKCNLNLNGGLSYTQTPGLVNGRLNLANSYTLSGGAVLSSNISPNLDFTLAYTANHNIVRNTLRPQLNGTYFSQSTTARINWIFLKQFVVNTSLAHNLYSGLSSGYNQNYLLWGGSVGYKFLKNNAGELSLSVFDALKQNNSITRTITETYIEDVTTQVLQRYFMLTFTYTVRNMNQDTKPKDFMNMPPPQGGMPPHGGGMPPMR